MDRAGGSEGGEKWEGLRAILGVKSTGLSGGIETRGAEGVGGVECSQIFSECLLISLAWFRRFCTTLLGSFSVGKVCRTALVAYRRLNQCSGSEHEHFVVW